MDTDINTKVQILFNQAKDSSEFLNLCKENNIKISDSTPDYLIKESWIKAKEEFNQYQKLL